MSLRLLRVMIICGAATLLALACPARVGAGQEERTGESFPFPSSSEGRTPSLAVEQPAPSQPTLKGVPRRIIYDQKFLWLRPFRIKRSDLPWLGFMVGTTAGLMTIDRRVGQGLSDSPPGAGYTFSHYVGLAGGPWTDLGVASVMYVVGRRAGDQHTESTGLLGIQAVCDSWVVVELLKVTTQRPRPTTNGGTLRNHNADGEFFTGGTSFPSGHTAGAFALATVVSERSREKPWVAPIAYGLASMVSVSRLTAREHFPSDIFVGAALGFLIGRHLVHSAEQPAQAKRLRSRLLPGISTAGGTSLILSWGF